MSVRVSVVVPAYNNADFIGATMESILSQSFTDFELIVADHSSSDQTMRILDEFATDPRVRLLRTEAGGGAARNWNRVSAEATGEYIKLVCGDDLLHPTALERQVGALDQQRAATMVAARRSIVDARGDAVISSRGLPGMSGLVPGAHAIRASVRAGTNIFGEPACVMIRREVLADEGWWDSAHPYLIDQATYARVLMRGDLIAIDDVLASFRLSSSQWSVELARSQYRQAAQFHESLSRDPRSGIRRADVLVGNARAFINSRMRRLVYVLLGRRMRSAESERGA